MNCKPGDVAVVIGDSKYAGKLFEVLYSAPTDKSFKLPDGVWHDACEAGVWVLKVVGEAVDAPFGGGFRKARYGCGGDAKLQPLRERFDLRQQTLLHNVPPGSE